MTKKLKLTIVDYMDYSPELYFGESIETVAKNLQKTIESGDYPISEWLSSKLKATVEVVNE